MKVKCFESGNTNVKKFVFEWETAIAEAVLYRYGSYRERVVICCSVQSGCPVGCSFCGTGKFFVRSLTTKEIIDQIHTVMETVDCNPDEIKKFQIMFMSMGEPFLNYSALRAAIYYLHEEYKTAQLLVSTSAPSTLEKYVEDFITISRNIPSVGLQFSVHESTDENRKKLIPTNTCSLEKISTIGRNWAKHVGRKPYFNYCVHEGNNTKEDAERLSYLFNPTIWECTLSVICEKDESVRSSIFRQLEIIQNFNTKMLEKGFSTRVFNPAGQDDIGGGCGQLWYFQEWLKKNKK